MQVKEVFLVYNVLCFVAFVQFTTGYEYDPLRQDVKIRPELNISQGRIVGKTLTTVGAGKIFYSFQGIPYAEPPVGELRFMPPKQLISWKGTLYAENDNKKCPQKDAIFDHSPHGEEDCLVLNVYTPSIKNDTDKKLPVMFWIHGGGFNAGSGNTDFFGPDNFMEEDIVLVTTNYRLGVLGFLDLEDDVVSGNMGLKDIVMALNWVKDNIKSFGGDSDQVTIFGNNAGGAIVSLLTHSPMAKGLFGKAICQSGVYKLPQLFNTKGKQRAFTLAKLFNKDPSDTDSLLKIFNKLSPYDFIKGAPKTFDSTEVRDVQKSIMPFGPSIEKGSNSSKAFLPRSPDDTETDDKFPDPNIPMMFGFNSKEAIVYLRSLINDPEILEKINYNFQFSLPFRGLQFVYNSEDYMKVSDEIRKFYFEDGVISNNSLENFVNYISDEIFYPVDKTLSEYLKISGAPVYYYRFSYEGSLNFYKRAVLDDVNSVSGASNGDEICYLFLCRRLKDVYNELYANEQRANDLAVSKQMVRMWSNFARYGDPTPVDDDLLDGLKWYPTTSSRHDYLNIDSNLEMRQNPGSQNVAFWDRIFDTYVNIDNTRNTNIKVEL